MTTRSIIPFVFEVDSDPSQGAGVTAPIGSVAYLTIGSGGCWYKTGSADTAWSVGGIIGQSTGVPVSQTPNQSNTTTLGGALTFAQSDHVHNIPTAAPVSIGSANSASFGGALTFAQSDHVHQGVLSFNANGGAARYGALGLTAGANVTVTDNGSGNFTIASLTELQVTAGSGLTLNYTAGACWINGVFYSIAAGSLTAPASTSGAVYVNTSGVVSQNATGVMPPNSVPMSTFVSNASTITLVTDRRAFIEQNLVLGLVADITAILPNASAASGSTNRYADAGHTHAIAVAAAVSQTPDQTNAAGSSTSFSRADHVHNIATAAPIAQTPNQTNAVGSASTFARSDHIHNIATAIAVGLFATTTNTQGSASTFAQSDHTHAIASAAAITQTPDQTNAVGVSTSFARADHVHNIPTAVVGNIGKANTAGTAASFARADHVHQGLHSLQAGASGTQVFGDVILAAGSNISITDSGSGTFTIASISLSSNYISSTTPFTTSSTTDVIITGFTATPPSGTYAIFFTGTSALTTNNAVYTVTIYNNGTAVADSVRTLNSARSNQSVVSASSTSTQVNGSQAIDVRVNISAGSVTVNQCNLILIRTGP